jgi:bacterioferritin-associated ferredoxin
MIVCSCNIITRGDIEAVIEEILADDPYAVLTPGLLYHRLGRRGKCCGCFPHVSRILVEHGTLVRERMERGEWSVEEAEPAPEEGWTPAA